MCARARARLSVATCRNFLWLSMPGDTIPFVSFPLPLQWRSSLEIACCARFARSRAHREWMCEWRTRDTYRTRGRQGASGIRERVEKTRRFHDDAMLPVVQSGRRIRSLFSSAVCIDTSLRFNGSSFSVIYCVHVMQFLFMNLCMCTLTRMNVSKRSEKSEKVCSVTHEQPIIHRSIDRLNPRDT